MNRARSGMAAPSRRGAEWLHDPRYLPQLVLVPIFSFAAAILWSFGYEAAFRTVQVTLAWGVVVQALFVFARAFERGWLEFFAYLLHFVAIGAASLTVALRFQRYPPDMLYDQMALAGLAGQLVLGTAMLASRPLTVRFALDPRVLAACAAVVCSAALVKFALYFQYIESAGGHFAVYTEGDALRDNSPLAIRTLAAGAPLIGLLALTQPKLPWWCRALGLLAIVLEFAVGIRSRPLFILLAAAALLQPSIRFTPMRKAAAAAAAVLGVIAIAAIGYYRENNVIGAVGYAEIVVESLFGIFEAGVFAMELPDAHRIVFEQLVPLLQPTPLGSVDTISKTVSAVYTPYAYLFGYGYSSAVLTEVAILTRPVLAAIAYPVAALAIIWWIKAAIQSPRIVPFLYGACVMPIAFYIWRAELWQLVVPVIKALPFLLMIFGLDQLSRQRRHRATAPAEGSAA